jgi:phenylpropionate dioxygenase-like ring-hydroxylating dioxygenase large terminal subunit
MSYLVNAWYVAAASREIGERPFRRVILDEPIVFYRKPDGTPVALFDRCPHRFAPLSRGKPVGDGLQCGYHGLQFGPDGICVLNPHGPIPDRARVKSYAIMEKYGFAWIWPGDASLADPALLPEMPLFDDPNYDVVDGYLSVAAHYQLLADNLLDLSHVEFLHPDFAMEDVLSNTRTEVLREGNRVHSNRWKPNCSVSRFLRTFWTSQAERGDARANIRWDPPGHFYLDLGVTDVGAPLEAGIYVPFLHLLTPETKQKTHYFWAMARSERRGEPAFDETIRKMATRAFEVEDEPMIEAQQAEIGPDRDFMAMRPMLLGPDAAATQARLILDKLIADERKTLAGGPANLETRSA